MHDGPARYYSIDGLRGFVALSVTIHHFAIWLGVMGGGPWVEPANNLLAQMGSGAVSIFFMITGFVFYPKVLAGYSEVDWTALLIGRVARLMPLVFVSVGCVALVAAGRGSRPLSFSDLQVLGVWVTGSREPDLFGLHHTDRINALVLWSLWWEWAFYLMILPALALLRMTIFRRMPSVLLPLVAFFAAALVRHREPGLVHASFFAIGMLAFEAKERTRIRAYLCDVRVGTLAAFGLLFVVLWNPHGVGLGVAAYAFFFACVAAGNSMGGVLESVPARVLGECSFGIYLLHGLALYLTCTTAMDLSVPFDIWPALIIPLPAAVVISASLTYLLIERPGISLGKTLVNHWGRTFSAKWKSTEVIAP